ncbi:hypothetical protein SAY87_001595 [Trapa incisa]|uniref:C2 domain-containing protein n=1 Tax=Trapa incisa TaxID=236973 RepID=A0AAN7JTM9_9MYRT|nr:hypothetical protein SAY87_001595 [Trapa incisa]
MASPPPDLLDLDITLISAKHLKNVNWRIGALKPYAAVFLDPNRRLSTRPDEHGSTSPVWNDSFTLPLPSSLADAFLTVEIFHSRPSETPKPLVGSLRVPLSTLVDRSESSSDRIHKLELLRPSGRPQGKVRLRLALRERRYHSSAPESSHYFSSGAAAAAAAHPPPHPPYPYARDYRDSLPSPRYGYSDQFPSYYYAHYTIPHPPAWPHFSRPPIPNTAGGPSAPPSAPIDFSYPTSDPKLMPPPHRWISEHGSLASVNLTRSDSYGALLSGPTAPEDQRPPRGPETAGLVVDALGGMNLGGDSRHGADYSWKEGQAHGHSSGDYHRAY